MKLHLPVSLRKALLACFSVVSVCTLYSGGIAAAADLTLDDDASLSADYADSSSITDLAGGTLTLEGGTNLLLSSCGEGDGKTYTLLTGVGGLLDAAGNPLTLTEENNAASLYFDTTQPGTGFWADAILQLSSDGTLQLVQHTETLKEAVTITTRQTGSVDYRFYAGVAFCDIFSFSSGGAIDGNGDITLSGNGSVEFSGNKASSSSSSSASGGAIYEGSSSTIELSDNGSVTFRGNTVSSYYAYGGAIDGSTITLSGNGSVEFSGNTASAASSNSNSSAYGGAIYGGENSTITLSGNGSVTFSGNTASASSYYARGGAIYGDYGSTIRLSGNGSVEFIGNTASSGGAIDGGEKNTITLSGNDSVEFSGNTASSSYRGYGGAIYTAISTITLSGNGSVTFSGNTASSSSSSPYAARGGAIYGDYSTITLSGNGSVTFSENTASSSSASGGAIYGSGNLSIRNNDSVLFEKNAEIKNGTYRLRSINVGRSGDTISLSAAEGKSIEFRDSVYISSGSQMELNADYTDADGVVHKQTGDILFTGAYAAQHLNKLLDDAGLARTATADEILNSRTTEVYAMTKLYGGRLRVEDGAVYRGQGITAKENSASTVLVKNSVLHHAGYDLTFSAGTTLELQGKNTIAGTVKMLAGSALSLVASADNATSETAVLTLDGALTLPQNGTITLRLSVDGGVVQENSYALITGVSDHRSWSESTIRVTTDKAGCTVSYDDLSWVGNTLWLYYDNQPDLTIATWTNESGNRLWDAASVNWEQNEYDYAYKDGVQVIFGDEGAGTVTLVGQLSPASVLVNSSQDYTWNADSTARESLIGSMKLTKDGSGKLTINTANSYTGGTIVNAGTLVAGSDSAFGTGAVELNGGVLELNQKPLENKLLAQGGIISGGSGFRGAVVFNGSVGLRGNLSASSVTINPGSVLTLNGSTISVSGLLTLGGSAVLKLNGSDFGDGDVLITFGSLRGSEKLLSVEYGDDSDKYSVEKKGNALILSWLEETQPEEEEKPSPLPPTEPDIPEQPVPALDRDGCDALVQSSWGVFTASHAFADAIGGQRSAAGYVGRQESVAWVSALGGMHLIDGSVSSSGSDIDLFGAAVGMEHYMSATDTVGIAVGRLSGDVRLKNSGRETEQSGTYFGLYGVHQLADFDRSNHLNLRWSAVYGDTETEGSIGQEKMSLRQDSVQLNARVDWASQLNDAWAVNVFAGMEYFASESAENEESEEARVRMGSIQNLRGELGIGTRYTSGSTTLYGELRYLNDVVRSNPCADINGVRGYGANPGRQGIGVTVGAQQELGGGWSVSASYSLEAMSEATMHSANVGVGLRF